MFYWSHCKDSRVKPGSPIEGAHTARMSLEREIPLDLEGKHKLYLLDESSAVRSRNNYHNLIRIGRVVSLYMNNHS